MPHDPERYTATIRSRLGKLADLGAGAQASEAAIQDAPVEGEKMPPTKRGRKHAKEARERSWWRRAYDLVTTRSTERIATIPADGFKRWKRLDSDPTHALKNKAPMQKSIGAGVGYFNLCSRRSLLPVIGHI